MKILSLIVILLVQSTIFVYSQSIIQQSINNFVNDNSLTHASVSFKIVDLDKGEVVAQSDAKRTLPTASTAKLFSTATALESLGPEYRPVTRIYYDGTVDSSGVLHGDIWIRGGGDPTLGSKYFNNEVDQYIFLHQWAHEIAELGIKQITGAIIADASEFGYEGVPNGWNWVDIGNYYGAGASGLTVYDNMLKITFRTSGYSGKPASINSIEPEIPGLTFHNYVLSSTMNGDNVYIYGGPYSLDRFASGTLPINSSSFLVKGSVPDPEFLFAHEFEKALLTENIEVSGNIKTVRQDELTTVDQDYSKKTLILTKEGEKLANIIHYTNQRSVNLFAEHMVNLVGYETNGNGSTESGLIELDKFWSNHFNTEGMQINDGSGLSRMNAISASNFVDLLTYMNTSKYKDVFMSSLPIAGESGTLRNVCKNQSAHGRLIAKSGSMTRIKSYAGYINSTSGKHYAFALIVNNYTCSSSTLKKKMEYLFNKIAIN